MQIFYFMLCDKPFLQYFIPENLLHNNEFNLKSSLNISTKELEKLLILAISQTNYLRVINFKSN